MAFLIPIRRQSFDELMCLMLQYRDWADIGQMSYAEQLARRVTRLCSIVSNDSDEKDIIRMKGIVIIRRETKRDFRFI
ncbi:hypothetical protein [Pseudoalteromonas xiamenensis]|uniref:Uncharacterized protein n=1 Tax=Pseudoalteromonas xiamenensis TaxID=882626 RepID=A0A975DGW4_9GAMM|nr:hypothetical protein [Pseudoalteromonas xiamenensis]QTH70882.1 hypothetical protein J5O05_13420 [Pseudoalteromonas xiamenensis]